MSDTRLSHKIVGLQPNPQEHALSQGQAHKRTQPILPLELEYVEGINMTTSSTRP